jgi:hypothetical protein
MMTEREGRKRSNDEMRRLKKENIKNIKEEKVKKGLLRVTVEIKQEMGEKGYLIKLRKTGKKKK